MALAPLSAGACRTGFVILTAKPIAGHAQRRAAGTRPRRSSCRGRPRRWIRAGDRHQPLDHRRAPHPGRRPCRRTPRQSRPPLPSSKRLPGTSVSLPGITLSDKGGQGERAHCRRSGASTGRPVWPSRPRRNGNSVASASRCVARSRWRAPGRDRTPDLAGRLSGYRDRAIIPGGGSSMSLLTSRNTLYHQ